MPDLARAAAVGLAARPARLRAVPDWPDGRSWRLGMTHLVIEQSRALSAWDHDRLRPGLNHLAFHAAPARTSRLPPEDQRMAGRCCSSPFTRTPAVPSLRRLTGQRGRL